MHFPKLRVWERVLVMLGSLKQMRPLEPLVDVGAFCWRAQPENRYAHHGTELLFENGLTIWAVLILQCQQSVKKPHAASCLLWSSVDQFLDPRCRGLPGLAHRRIRHVLPRFPYCQPLRIRSARSRQNRVSKSESQRRIVRVH